MVTSEAFLWPLFRKMAVFLHETLPCRNNRLALKATFPPLAWGAAWLSRRAPTARRTYGYGRSSILAALANAVLLLVGTGGIILEAVSRLSDPEPVKTGIVMAVALCLWPR